MPSTGSSTPLRVGLAGLGAVSGQVLRAFADCEGVVLAGGRCRAADYRAYRARSAPVSAK